MTKKYKFLLTLLMLLCMSTRMMAVVETYVVYNNGTLTFYHDDMQSSRAGIVYLLDEAYCGEEYPQPKWTMYFEDDIVRAVFDDSFKNATPTTMFRWFFGCENLTMIVGGENVNTSMVTDMSYLFCGCLKLSSIDVGGWDTSHVTLMERMFYNCESLTSLDVSKWDTSKVKDMEGLFRGCKNLTSLDVSKWDTSNVNDMNALFYGCNNLTSLDVSKWDTSNVSNMQWLFDGCRSLTTLDVSNWNTFNATKMAYLFRSCGLLTSLDLSNWDTSGVITMEWMFAFSPNLTRIYCGDKWTTINVQNSKDMFKDCTQLVGGAGTTYDANHTDASYAHIDGGPSNPGYLSTIQKYNLMVEGVQMTDKNKDNVHGTSFDPSTNTLTLDNFYLDTQEESEFGINNNNEMSPLDYDVDVNNLTIHVKGDNTIRTTAACLYLKDVNLTITGPGKLNLTSFSNNAIHVNHSTLTLDNAKVYAKGNVSAIRGRNGSQMTVNHSSLEACSAEETQATILDFNSVELINSYYEDVINNSDESFYGEYIYYNNGAQALWYDGEYGIDEGFGGMESYDYYYLYKVLISPTAMTPTTVDAARLNDKGQMINDKGRDGWYTLDGRRLDGKPAEKGVYLWNDKKVIVK